MFPSGDSIALLDNVQRTCVSLAKQFFSPLFIPDLRSVSASRREKQRFFQFSVEQTDRAAGPSGAAPAGAEAMTGEKTITISRKYSL